MSNYRKLIVAIVGVVAMILGPNVLGITPGEELFGIGKDVAVQIIVGIGAALGVWAAPNTPKPPTA